MTEVEKIIEKGVIPSNFLEPEIICDFYVDEKRKKIWAIGIDLLIQFDIVCRRHNLRYSLAFGTLLGCVRHHGFIPWDDDVDVVMPREDYESLKKYKSEFETPYFLQYPGEDDGYLFSFAKLRNSNTSGISWAFRYESFNQGLFLDIFPIDNYCPINLDYNLNKIKVLVDECSAMMRRSCLFPDENDLRKLSLFPIVRDKGLVCKELDDVLRQFENIPTDKYFIWSCLFYKPEKLIFDKSLLDDLIEINWYNHDIYIPRNFDKVLRIIYGDYMQYPPVEQRGTWHSQSIFNPDSPYQKEQQKLWERDKNKEA